MIHFIWIGFVTLFLTSCATVTPPASTSTSTISWQNRSTTLNRIQNWQLSGKVAVQTARDSGSASVDWQQRQGNYTIALSGPLGSNGVKLTGRPGTATVDTSDGKHFTANSPEQLLAQNWGFNLPVSYLRYWIRGIPVSGVPATTHFDAANRLSSLSQAGWNIQFENYTNANGVELPARITATSAAMKVKMVIYQWQV